MSGLLLGGAMVAAEISGLTSSAIVSFNEYKDQRRKYMESIQQGKNPEDLVKPVYLDIFKGEVRYLHSIFFGSKYRLTNSNK